MRLVDEIGQALREKGITLEEFMELGRELREELIKARYGVDPEDD